MSKIQSPKSKVGDLLFRTHGSSGPIVIVLHGGPGAPGSAAGLARGLADSFRVIEPWQRGSGEEPLSVARHVADLHELVRAISDKTSALATNDTLGFGPWTLGYQGRPALIGESWGAMLALAYAAAYPESAGPLVLAGCGTFDPVSRVRMRDILDARMGDDRRNRLENLEREYPDPGERLRHQFELIRPLYDYDPVPEEPEETEAFDHRAHTETWNDMVRLEEARVYPAAFAAITSPVLMLHGDYDPHPGKMIYQSLEPFIPHLEYHELGQCGHSPWRERKAKEEFFGAIKEFLLGGIGKDC